MDLIQVEPGAHIGVSGSRYAPTQEAVNSLRFLIDQFQAMGAIVLHQGCCTGWDEVSVDLAHKAGLYVDGHPPTKQNFLSEKAVRDSDHLWVPKPYHARDRDLAFETVVLITGPRYPEDHPQSAHSGTWLTTGFARLYGSRVYACLTDGSIEDVTERTESDDRT
jgi:hypothetical protein